MSWLRVPLIQSLRYSVPLLQLRISASPYPQAVAVTLARHSSQLPAGSVDPDVEKLKGRPVPGYEKLFQDGQFDDNLAKVYSLEYARKMEWNKLKVKTMVDQLKIAPGDTGSTPVQIGALTVRIQYLTDHMKRNKKDKNCLRSLIQLVHRRRRLLKYLQRKDFVRYHQLLSELNLRTPVEQKYKHTK